MFAFRTIQGNLIENIILKFYLDIPGIKCSSDKIKHISIKLETNAHE